MKKSGINMKSMKEDANEMEKDLNRNVSRVNEQTKKMEELDQDLNKIDSKLDAAEQYQKGLKRGFWGFVPDFFTGIFHREKKFKPQNKYTPQKIEKKEEIKQITNNQSNIHKSEKQKKFDSLMSDLNSLKKEAEAMRIAAENSNKKAEELDEHLDFTNQRIEKVNRTNEILLKK